MVLIPRLAKQILRRSGEALLGMHMRQLMVLSYLRDHGDAPQQDLADVMCVDANNVVLLLNELEDLGYVSRRRDPHDRRRHRVEITPSGRAAVEYAEQAQQEVEDDVLQTLTAGERATLWDLLSRALHSAEPPSAGKNVTSRSRPGHPGHARVGHGRSAIHRGAP
jgi:DNA-binding MarR family transcriptional regulator